MSIHKKIPKSSGIALKKRYGQHFLREERIVQRIVDYIDITDASVMEIGCGDGFLTRKIVEMPIARLWVFEIDESWAELVRSTVKDERLSIFIENILDIDAHKLEEHAPWVLLANLPYQITFPILFLIQRNRELFREGVIMVQEEVAQKILKKHGRNYGLASLFFQYYFEWKMLDKIPPSAFYPPPKVNSRLLYFKPKKDLVPIPEEEKFWKFIKVSFRQPRRTLRNNLMQYHCDFSSIPDTILSLRAQQMTFDQLLELWEKIRHCV